MKDVRAATVIPLRDADDGLEVLMLRKNSKIAFGGMWVFPGGRIDAEDHDPAGDEIETARRAAVREAQEEADLRLPGDELIPFSHWTPPDDPGVAPRRFLTWFFVARAADEPVTIDGGEIHDDVWVNPGEMLRRRDAGEIQLAPPTIVTLHELAAHGEVDPVLQMAAAREPFRYATRVVRVDGGAVTLWQGDAGYETVDLDLPGARHRLYMTGKHWRFENSTNG